MKQTDPGRGARRGGGGKTTVLPRIEFGQITFTQPEYLWLLVVPALLILVWCWRFSRRRRDAQRLARACMPVRKRFALVGELPFWLFLICATICLIVALARPHGPASPCARAAWTWCSCRTARRRCG